MSRRTLNMMDGERMNVSDTRMSGGLPTVYADESPIALDATGVPGLDTVLGGGIQRGSLMIVAGPSGGGKTILAHQIAFAAARAGRGVTILTAFSEPTNKLIAHMSSFGFFDRELLGGGVQMFSIQQFLKQGLTAAVDEVVEVARSARSQLVVLDGFRGVRETAEQPIAAQRFVYDVSNRLSVLGVSLLLTTEAHVRDSNFFAEATTADVLLGVAFDAIEARERRTIEVMKARGTTPLTGRHALSISDAGIAIHPRLEALVAASARVPAQLGSQGGDATEPKASSTALATTGFPALDQALGGGLGAGLGLLVTGGIGAGKTLLSLHFALAGIALGEPVVFAGFHETAEQLVRKARNFAWGGDLERAVASGQLRVLRVAPVEMRADVFADDLLRAVEATGARRVALDEVGEVQVALRADGYERRFHDFVAALHEALRRRGMVSLLTYTSPYRRRTEVEDALGEVAMLAENVVWLRRKESRDGSPGDRRRLSILKTGRFTVECARLVCAISADDGVTIDMTRGERTEHTSASPSGKRKRERKERGNGAI